MPRRLFVLIAVFVLLFNALPVFAQEKRGVDVVIILDTSGPMLNGFDKFCVSFPKDVAALQQRGFDLQVTILGITKPYSCAKDTVRAIAGSTVASDNDWGAAISDVATKQPWRSDSMRLIVPLSNRGPALGDPVDDPGADRDAIKKAIGAAQANRVVVLPVLGALDPSQSQPGDRTNLEKLAHDLAQATGGQTIALTSNDADPTQDIFRVIGQVTQVENSTLVLSIPAALRTLTCRRDVTKCVSLDLGVLITNAIVTLLIVSIAGMTTALYTAGRARAQAPTVKIDERVKNALTAGTQKVRRGYRTIFAPGSWTIGTPLIRWLLATALIVVFVGLTALLNAFIDPQFNTTTGRGIAIFLTLFVAIGLVTWSAAWSEVGAARQAKLNAALRVRPLTLVITIVAVFVTRALNFLPGFLVALFLSYAIFNADDIRKAEQRASLRSLLLLVIIIVAAYLLAIPVDLLLGNLLAQAGNTVAQTGADAAGVAESLILTIYIVALQYAFFTLLPSRFTNGSRLFELNRVLWGVSFGLITFTLLHTAINPTLSGVEVFRLPPVIIIGGLLLVASAVALAMWLRVNDRGWQNDKPQDSRLMLSAIVLLVMWVFVCGCAAVYLITQIGK